MRQSDFEIKQIFAQENELPQIVIEKKQAAYDAIYSQCVVTESMDRQKNYHNRISQKKWYLPKAAAVLIACFLLTGVTAVAAVGILSRWDRMKNLDKETIEQLYEDLQLSGNLSFQASRSFTEQEKIRYGELEKAYRNDQVMPNSEISRMQEGEKYSGEGVCLMVTNAGEEHILYLPETELTDEEMLEIIDYLAKQEYAFYEMKKEQVIAKGNWESRLEAMTDEEVDYHYLALWSGQSETSDGLCRGSFIGEVLNEEEKARYQELEKIYEDENRVPAGAVKVIENPEEYADEGIALCRYDGNFYLPEKELTDEELLQIIDFRKKAYYSMERIREEIRLGYRKDFPKLTHESAQIDPIEALAFSETDGKGRLKQIGEAAIGDIVKFGNYEQDGDEGNGKEAIEWYVLDTTDETMTLLSVKILDAMSYSSDQKKTTWKESEIRQWLNDEFYKAAFSGAAENAIVTTTVENTSGDTTEDKVYLLSHHEFLAYFGVSAEALTDMQTVKENELRNLKNLEQLDSRIFADGTQTALDNGVWAWTEETTLEYLKFLKVDYSSANGNSAWWLRTVDANGPSAYTIAANGDVDSLQYVDSLEGIRPAIRIRR